MVSLVPEVWDKSSFLRYTTEADGKFIFRRAEPGRYRLQARATGYPVQNYGQRSPNSQGMVLELTQGCRLLDLEFRLLPGGAISGIVYDENGEPAVGARVAALRSGLGPRRYLYSVTGAETNDHGEYRMFGLSPGRYFVRATLEEAVVRKTAVEDRRLQGFHPDSLEREGAIPLDLAAGNEMPEVNIVLQRVSGASIRGRVTSHMAGALRGQAVAYLVPLDDRAVLPDDVVPRATLQVETGEFEIKDVPSGSYVLFVATYYRDQHSFVRTSVEVTGGDVEGLHLTLTRPIEVSGRVRAEPAALPDFTHIHVRLEPFKVPFAMMAPTAEVKSDGSMRFRSVPPEEYRLQVQNLPEGFYVKSARLGGKDVLQDGPITVAEGSIGLLEITISPNGARIEGGVVEDGEPAPGATVVLIPDPPNRHREDLFRATQTDQHGAFLLSGIAPGDYRLFAWDAMEGEAYKAPEFIERYESQGSSVRIKEGGIQRAELRLIRAEEFAFK
jgi:hypothetical protein